MIVVSWVYVALCIIEPGNREARPYEIHEAVYKFIITIEGIIQMFFLVDSLIKTYI